VTEAYIQTREITHHANIQVFSYLNRISVQGFGTADSSVVLSDRLL